MSVVQRGPSVVRDHTCKRGPCGPFPFRGRDTLDHDALAAGIVLRGTTVRDHGRRVR